MNDTDVEFRELKPSEYPSAVDLWKEVFNVEAPFFTSLLEGGEDTDNVSLAALAEGKIVSSVHVFMRQIRGRDGRSLKVGGIGSVSTHPEHRKRGLSGRLLEMALEAMEREGCVWSFLGTGVNDHYARYGWRTVSTPHRIGTLRPNVGSEGTILTLNDATLDAMATLYEASSATRPMATIRSQKAWRTAVRYRLDPARAVVFAEYEGNRLAAYLVARNTGEYWRLSEVAGDEDRFNTLFAAAAAHSGEKIVSILPRSPAIDEALASIAESITPGESRGEMVRPIANRISWPDLLALYGDPRGRHCDLDAF